MTGPKHFEDELLTQLRHLVAEQPSPAAERRRLSAPLLRSRLALSGGGLAVLGAAAVILISGSGSGTPSAYAVSPQSDGSVTVHVRSLSDAAGLQSSLRAAGIPATVSYDPAGKLPPCPLPKGATLNTQSGSQVNGGKEEGSGRASSGKTEGPRFSTGGPAGTLPAPPAGAVVTSSEVQVSKSGVTFTISAREIKADQQLMVTTSQGTLTSMGVAVVPRTLDPCSATPPAP